MISREEVARNIGREVVYTPYRGKTEEGVIEGVSPMRMWVMVRFGADMYAKATAPGALDFIGGES